MNPEKPRSPRDELEARLTTLLLGELPATEAVALRELIATDAQLAELHERLKRAIDLVREAAATVTEPASAQAAPLKLSNERRQKLLAHFKTVAPKEFVPHPRRREWSWLVPLGAAAAAIMLLAAIAIPNFTRARESAMANSVLNNLRILEGAKDQWALENKKSQTDVVTLEDLKDYLKGGVVHPVQGEHYIVGRVSDPVAAEVDVAQAKKTFGGLATKQPPQTTRGQRARLNAEGELTFVDKNGMTLAGAESGGRSSAPEFLYKLAAKPPAPSWQGGSAPAKAFKGDARPLPMPLAQESAREVESLEVRQAGTTPRQEIVLPPSDAQDDWANAKLEGPSNQGGRGLSLGSLLAQSTTGGRGGVFGGGGGIGGGGGAGFGPVADAQPDSNVRNAWLFGNPKSIGILESPAPTSGGSTNQFVARYQFALDTPPAAGDVTAFGLQPGQPAVPNYSPVDLGAKLPENSRTDNKALGFAWNTRGLERERRMGIRGDLAPPVAAQPSKAKPDIRDADADKLDGALLLSTINGRALQEKRGASGAAGAAGTPAPGAASPARTVDRLDRSGPVAPKPDGIDDRYAYQVPRLGDAPELGRFYKIKPELFDAEAKPGSKVELSPQITGKDLSKWGGVASGFSQNDEQKSRTDQNIASVGEPATTTIPLDVERTLSFTNTGQFIFRNTATSEEGARRQSPSIVLPSAAPDTTAGVPIAVTGSLIPEDEAAKVKPSVSERSAPARTLETETMARVEAAGESAKKQEADLLRKDRPYLDAKRELDNQQKLRDALALRVQQEIAEASLPRKGMVEITDLAEARPAESPKLPERLWGAVTGKVKSTARISIEKEVSDIAPLGFSQNSSETIDPSFIRAELEKIRSKAVLDKVIDKLKLSEAWAKKDAQGQKLTQERTYEILKNSIEVRPDANTSLVDITVKSDKSEEAARIANTIAEVYRDSRRAASRGQAPASVEFLKRELAEQDTKVAQAKEKLERLQRETNNKQADATPPKSTAPAPIPQPEVQTRDNAYSTFALNVSDVSFKLGAASLEKSVMPEPATVRSEEFINAFDYRDPEPPPGVPITFAWERTRYPFAHSRDLLRFSVKTAAAGRQPGRPLNLVLLLDNSGSMERADRVQIIHEALRVLATQLQPQDKLSVVTFARTARLWVDGVAGNEAGAVAEQISNLTPQGGTNLGDAMDLAYQTALRHYLANGGNRIVLLTDGAANLGNVDPDALKQKVETHRKQGIALDCFGIGWEGYNDDLLEILSRNGDGRYGFINTSEEAASDFAGQLAGALRVAASDVKVQVEFNPARVTAYRQIGYAKHQLTKEQFRDNTVDAAEIGAAEAGNALYVAEVNARGEGPLAIVRVRYKVPGTADYREHEWAVPYAGNAVSLEQASPAMRLAATASAFSEWLVSSPYAAEITPDRLLGYLGGVPETYGADARPKKLEWMIRQAKSISGK